MLSGCDKVPLTPRDAIEAAKPFGTPVKEKVGESEEGELFRWTVEARRQATWSQAFGVIHRQLRRCPDGQIPEDVEYSPQLDRGSPEDYTREYPAGTHFIVVRRCPAPPDFQFTFDRPLTHEEAQELMRERLLERAGGPLVMPIVIPMHATESVPLHETVRISMASFSHSQASQCPEAFRFSYLSLGVQPQPARDDETPDAYLAFLMDCADGLKSDPWPPEKPGA